MFLGVWNGECPFRQDKFPLAVAVTCHLCTLYYQANPILQFPVCSLYIKDFPLLLSLEGRTERHAAVFSILPHVILKSAFINSSARILRDEIVWPGPESFKVLLGHSKMSWLWSLAGNFQAAVLISQISPYRGTYLNLTSTDKQMSFKRFINQAGALPTH